MKISHESPLCLLEKSLKYNDYQYILPTFWNKYSQYKEFMLKYRQQKDSFIILDNGLFEGDTYSNNELIEIINLSKPDIFIVPDSWNNVDETFKNAKYWINVIKSQIPSTTNLMVVLQGETLDDIKSLHMGCLDLGYMHFSFNHSSILYPKLFPHKNPLVSQMMGRILLINKMLPFINNEAYYHLLGCSDPIEFKYYKEYNFIKSCDTSCPIINGALNILLNPLVTYNKPKEKLEVFMEEDLSSQESLINFNIKTFKTYALL
jgi:hypothetical protein